MTLTVCEKDSLGERTVLVETTEHLHALERMNDRDRSALPAQQVAARLKTLDPVSELGEQRSPGSVGVDPARKILNRRFEPLLVGSPRESLPHEVRSEEVLDPQARRYRLFEATELSRQDGRRLVWAGRFASAGAGSVPNQKEAPSPAPASAAPRTRTLVSSWPGARRTTGYAKLPFFAFHRPRSFDAEPLADDHIRW